MKHEIPSPGELISSRAQEPAVKDVFHTMNHCDATTLASMIANLLSCISTTGSINPNRATAG